MHNTRWYKNCSLKHMHNTGWNKTVLGETHTIPGGMNISFRRSSEEGGILGAWYYTRQVGRRRSLRKAVQFQGIPSRTAAKGNPRVLVLYQEEWGSVDPSAWPSNSREFQVVLRAARFQGRRRCLNLHQWAAGGGGVICSPSSIPG